MSWARLLGQATSSSQKAQKAQKAQKTVMDLLQHLSDRKVRRDTGAAVGVDRVNMPSSTSECRCASKFKAEPRR